MNKNKKMKKKICNVFILDASGSMESKREEVVGEVRENIRRIKADKTINSKTIITDFAGSNDFRVLANSRRKDLFEDIADVYNTRGLTSLYDAIGKTFEYVSDRSYDGVIVNIITDGLENSSTEYNLSDIQELIREKRSKGWAILFSGTTEAAIQSAKEMGVSAGNTTMFKDTPLGYREGSERRYSINKSYTSALVLDEQIDVDNLA